MVEIESLEQATQLYNLLFTLSDELDKRAYDIAKSVIQQIEKQIVADENGQHVCPHYGGDYWLFFGPKPEYFCNIPSVSDGWGNISPTFKVTYAAALEFLVSRNRFLEQAIGYFRDNSGLADP